MLKRDKVISEGDRGVRDCCVGGGNGIEERNRRRRLQPRLRSS
jgi:hypothetical protein